MTFRPVVPTGGVSGWRYLQRTMATQQAAFDRAAVNARDIEYFKANIARAGSAEKLVADRVLLKVALGAFGLSEEAFKKAFIRTALEEGTEDRKALANRLADPKYREMAAAFGYGDAKGPQVARPGFAEEIAGRYRVRAFEEAVGAVDSSMRLALNFEREAARLGAAGLEDRTAWFRILGDKPLRAVFEGAFGLPTAFGKLDVDRQAEVLAAKTEKLLGRSGVAALADPEARDRILRQFFVREQIAKGPAPGTPGLAALTILQGPTGPGATLNLLLSRF